MIVLKIIGFILLGTVALIIVALSIKVRVFIEYSEIDTNVRLQWLFLKIPVYPSKKDKNKKTDTKNNQQDADIPSPQNSVSDASEEIQTGSITEEAGADVSTASVADETGAEAQPQNKKKNSFMRTLYDAHGIDGLMLIVNRAFSHIGTFVGDFMHSFVIDELYIDVMCTKNDAASTAIYYGEVCTGLFPMLGALVTKYKVRKYDINVYPDFLAKTSSASFAVSMHLYPIYSIGITFVLVFRLLFKVILRLLVKCFLPSKKKETENNIKADSKETAA